MPLHIDMRCSRLSAANTASLDNLRLLRQRYIETLSVHVEVGLQATDDLLGCKTRHL